MSAQEAIRQIEGLNCSNFKLLAGGSLILYIGSFNVLSGKTDWRLFIDCAWRLDSLDGPLLGSFDTLDCGDDMEDAATERCLSFLRTLVGRKIISAEYKLSAGDAAVRFESGIALKLFSHATEGDAWELRHSSGRRFGICDCCYAEWQEDADTPST
jgi:hypothetical protein